MNRNGNVNFLHGSPSSFDEDDWTPTSATIPYKPGELEYVFDDFTEGNLRDFKFAQVRASGNRNIAVRGNVSVLSARPGAPSITVVLDVKMSHSAIADGIEINYSKDDGLLEFRTTDRADRDFVSHPRIIVDALIYVASSARFGDFSINTESLHIDLKAGLSLATAALKIHTVSGGVKSNSRSIYTLQMSVETLSGQIDGMYPLVPNSLKFKSDSGSVGIEIYPSPLTVSNKVGQIDIRTISGAIEVKAGSTKLADGDFSIRAETVSGSIKGAFVLGHSAQFITVSGAIHVDLLSAGKRSAGRGVDHDVYVNSVSGAVHPHFKPISDKLGAIRAQMNSVSGEVNARLPASWEGVVRTKTVTGREFVTGPGTGHGCNRQTSNGFMGIGRATVLSKGNGTSTMSAETVSGCAGFTFYLG